MATEATYETAVGIMPAGGTVPTAANRSVSSNAPASAMAMLLRLHLTYLWRHRQPLSLGDPQLFTELVQRRKLVDRDPRIPRLIDKVTAKQIIADTLGPEWITPTLWSGEVLPDAPPCLPPFVVKSRHGCRQMRVVRGESVDWYEIMRAAT